MDTTIVNVAYNDIGASMGATLDEISWISTAYTLAGLTIVPLTGWLVDRFGRKRIFLATLYLFGIGSLLCAVATNVPFLAAARMVQGLGGGLLITLPQAILIDAYPDDARDDALNLMSVTAMMGPIAGPILGGFLLDRLPWPAVFFVNIPLVAATIIMSMRLDLDQSVSSKPAPTSIGVLVVLWAALLGYQFVLQSGQRLDWFASPAIRLVMFISLVLGAALVIHQLYARHPMIDFRVFVNREFLIGNILGVVGGGSNFAIAFIGPLFLQEILGYPPLLVGLLTLPSALAMFAGNRVSDYLAPRIRLPILLSAGVVGLAAALWYNGVYADMASLKAIVVLRIIQGFAIGLFFVPLAILTLSTIQKRDIDKASGMFSLVRMISGMVAIALVGTLLTHSRMIYFERLMAVTPAWRYETSSHATVAAVVSNLSRRADVLAFQHVFAVTALCLVGTVVAFLIIALLGSWANSKKGAEAAATA